MTDGKISTRIHETPLSQKLMGGGTIQISEAGRPTEEGIEIKQPEATDIRAEMESQGLYRCAYDGQWLPASEFSPDRRKRNGLKSICKSHAAASERQREARRYLQAVERAHYRMRHS